MNESQQQLYFKRWGVCVRANNWRMAGGRLLPEARGSDASEWHAAAWTAAEQIAGSQHRAVIPDDLRKGSHVAAFGSGKSSKILSNPEFNRLLIWWGNGKPRLEGGLLGLLVDPLDLASISAWRDPLVMERASFISFLRKQAHEGTLRAIARNAYDTTEWESLEISKLRWLAKELKGREPSRKTFYRQKLATIEREYDPTNAPY